jgi:hypothetical protein
MLTSGSQSLFSKGQAHEKVYEIMIWDVTVVLA